MPNTSFKTTLYFGLILFIFFVTSSEIKAQHIWNVSINLEAKNEKGKEWPALKFPLIEEIPSRQRILKLKYNKKPDAILIGSDSIRYAFWRPETVKKKHRIIIKYQLHIDDYGFDNLYGPGKDDTLSNFATFWIWDAAKKHGIETSSINNPNIREWADENLMKAHTNSALETFNKMGYEGRVEYNLRLSPRGCKLIPVLEIKDDQEKWARYHAISGTKGLSLGRGNRTITGSKKALEFYMYGDQSFSISIHTDSPTLQAFIRGSFFMEDGRYNKALEFITPLIDLMPRHPAIYSKLAEINIRKRDFPEALKYLQLKNELSHGSSIKRNNYWSYSRIAALKGDAPLAVSFLYKYLDGYRTNMEWYRTHEDMKKICEDPLFLKCIEELSNQ